MPVKTAQVEALTVVFSQAFGDNTHALPKVLFLKGVGAVIFTFFF